MEELIFLIIGLISGFAISSGVFALITALSLIPRIADKTHTGKYMMFYESCVLYGSLLGNVVYFSQQVASPFSILPIFIDRFPSSKEFLQLLLPALLIIIGTLGGIFVGTLAVSIAESLDVTAVFFRRSKIHLGIAFIVLSFALGKMFGSFFFFWGRFFSS